MNGNLSRLVTAQFLSAFADNAVLFTAISLVLSDGSRPAWYIPVLQGAFLVAYVVLAPWVGHAADRYPKARVLALANAVKAAGAVLLLAGVDPVAAYGLVGVGAALYSPAKYGILPEIVGRDGLVGANGWVEGGTIVAIVAGAVAGSWLADHNPDMALGMIVLCYGASALVTLWIRTNWRPNPALARPWPHFSETVRTLLSTARGRFATLGVTLFWSAAVVLRVALVAWAPVVLAVTGTTPIAVLTVFCAGGIALGSLLAPRLVALDALGRARFAAYAMGAAILLLAMVDTLWAARAVLFAVGLAGGVFVVPMNAALQEIGHRGPGAGGAVATQHAFENLGMVAATGIYALALAGGADPATCLMVLGITVVVATGLVSRRLPEPVVADADSGADADHPRR